MDSDQTETQQEQVEEVVEQEEQVNNNEEENEQQEFGLSTYCSYYSEDQDQPVVDPSLDEQYNKEDLVENLKEALAERERRMQLQKLNSEEVISPQPSFPLPPPALPPKMRGRHRSRSDYPKYDQLGGEQKRIIDFSENKYPMRKRGKKRSHSLEYSRKSHHHGPKPGDPIYRRSALISLHPVITTNEPVAYDPLKLVESDDDDIKNLVLQANNLEIRTYNEKHNQAVEVLYPSYYQHKAILPKKNLKSAIPEVFSKLAQEHESDQEFSPYKYDAHYSVLPPPPPNFEAIRSKTLPSFHFEPKKPTDKKSRYPFGERNGTGLTEVWPSDITDFDSVSTSENETAKNSEKLIDYDDSFAYDTVADQTDFEPMTMMNIKNHQQAGMINGKNKIVCDKYVLCENNQQPQGLELLDRNTFPKRIHVKPSSSAQKNPNLGGSYAIALSNSSKRQMVTPTLLMSQALTGKNPPISPAGKKKFLGKTRSSSLDSQQVESPRLITAVKHISTPERLKIKQIDEVVNEPADRIVEIPPLSELSENNSFASLKLAAHKPQIIEEELIGVAGLGGAGGEYGNKNLLIEKQQQLILEQLKQLNNLQKLQLHDQHKINIEPAALQPPQMDASSAADEQTSLEPTAPPFGAIQPIVVTTHVDQIERVTSASDVVDDVAVANQTVVQVDNPLAGRPLGDVLPNEEEETKVGVQQGADSGIDLPNYDAKISCSSSNAEKAASEAGGSEDHDMFPSPNQQIQRAKEIARIRRWYRDVYLKPRCCFSCLRVFIFSINLLFAMIAISLLGISLYGTYDLLLDRISDPLLAFIDPIFAMSIIGAIMLVVCLSALLGFCKEKLYLIKFFAYVLIGTCFLFFFGAIVFWVFKDQFPEFLSGYVFRRLIENYGGENRVISGFAIDQIQQNFQCCGFNDISDWQLNSKFACVNSTCSLPDSCCSKTVACVLGEDLAFESACMDSMSTFVDDHNGIIAAVWGGLMLLAIIEFVCTHYMVREVMYRIVINAQIKLLIQDLIDLSEPEYTGCGKKSKKAIKARKKKKRQRRKGIYDLWKKTYVNPSYE